MLVPCSSTGSRVQIPHPELSKKKKKVFEARIGGILGLFKTWMGFLECFMF